MKKHLLLLLLVACSIFKSQAQTETWQQKASLLEDIPARALSNMVAYGGKLYFFGGRAAGPILDDLWAYDPLTKKFTREGTLPEVTLANTSAVVGNKLFYGLGYTTTNATQSLSWREYNFTTKTFTSKAPFPGERLASGSGGEERPTSFVINDNIYVMSTSNNLSGRTLYSYNTVTDKWTILGPHPGNSRSNAISFSINGKGYFGGGSMNSSFFQDFYEYNPVTNIWTAKAIIPIAGAYGVSAASNGKGYIGAGLTSAGALTNRWYEYNPTTNVWAQKSSLLNSTTAIPLMFNSTSAAIGTDVFLFSGYIQGGAYRLSTMYKYSTTANAWTEEVLHAGGNRTSSNSIFYNGKIYVTGGHNELPRKDVWAYDIAANTWEQKKDMISYAFAGRAQTILNDKLYVVGGHYPAWNGAGPGSPGVYMGNTNELLEYSPAADTWAAKAICPMYGYNMAAFTVNGQIYAGLGSASLNFPSADIKSLYKYTPTTNSWAAVSAAPENILPVGSFVIGNIAYIIASDSKVFSYNTQTNTWLAKKPFPIDLNGSSYNYATNKAFTLNSKGYFVADRQRISTLFEYNETADTWQQKSGGNNLNAGSSVIVAGNDVYQGFGKNTTTNQATNEWWKLTFSPPVSTTVAEIQHADTYLLSNGIQTLYDNQGNLIASVKSEASSGDLRFNFKSAVISSASAYREHEGWFGGTKKELGMYFNRSLSFDIGTQSGFKLKLFAPKTEVDKFILAFNAKYGTAYTENDIMFVSQKGAVPDLNPLNQPDNAVSNTAIKPTIGTYLTTNKTYEVPMPSGSEFYLALSTKRAAQTLTFATLTNKIYGTTDFDPGATSTNLTIPVTYTSSNLAVATIVAGKVHIVGVGTTTITAKQTGDGKFYDATDVPRSLIVTQAPLTIKADDKSKVQGMANPTLTATYTGFVNGETNTVLTVQPTLSTTAVLGSAIGTYPITVNGATSSNYTIAYVAGQLTVIAPKLAQTITFASLGNRLYGNVDFDPAAISTNATIPITYLSSNLAVATIVAGKLHVVGAGTTTITAKQAGNVSYLDAVDVSSQLTITKAPLTIKADDKSKIQGTANPTLTATYTGFVYGETNTALTVQPTLSTTAVLGSAIGIYPINVNGATSSNYTISHTAGQFTITSAKLAQTLFFPILGNRIYGTTDYDPGAVSSNASIPITYTSSNLAVATIVTGKIHVVGAGTTTITAKQAGNISYLDAADVSSQLTITKAPLTIKADDKSKVQDTANPTLTATYTGFVYGETNAVLTVQPLLSTTAVLGSAAGVYPIVASGAVAQNYTITYTPGQLTVTSAKLAQTITFAGLANRPYGNVDFDPAAISTNTTIPITYLSSNLAVATIVAGKIHVLGAGTTNITAKQAGNTNYLDAADVSSQLIITKASLTIKADDKSKVQGTANPMLTATYIGFVYGESNIALTVQPLLSTTAVLGSTAGVYPIVASGAIAQNYSITYTLGQLTISPSVPSLSISSFSPATTGAGATITIIGQSFTGATKVSFGGVNATSFTVLSATTINAVVANGASGVISVTNGLETATISGFTFVPKPTIIAGSSTTFATGGSVILAVNPASGYSYKWLKNGVEIFGATTASYTATEAGSYTVSIALNGSTPILSDAIVVNVGYILPAANFTLKASSESCSSSNNGKINIIASSANNYTAILKGNGINLTKQFTTSVDFTDLPAGTYNVCMSVAGVNDYKQCFDLVITEPAALSVYANVVNANKLNLIFNGSDNYFVELNGAKYNTSKSTLTLDLKEGNNTLKVFTAKTCQGTFSKSILVGNKPLVYPNPFDKELNLTNLPGGKTKVEISSLEGKIAFSNQYFDETAHIFLKLDHLNSGMYVLKVTTEKSISIFKVIKK